VKESNSLALVVAYYLSRFDRIAYDRLGFGNSTETHVEVGRILEVKPNSVKNMRDEFDPIHDNSRVGWYQRPLRPSRAKVLEAFQDLSEEELYDVVQDILRSQQFRLSDDLADIIDPIVRREAKRKGKSVFIVRGPTGRIAEEAYLEHHRTSGSPVAGQLQDTRDLGCGYDFEIHGDDGEYQVEVKGLDGEAGGVSFTSKEWHTAREKGKTYFLVIVRNASSTPQFQVVQDPARKLSPRKSVYTVVQVRWNADETELRGLSESSFYEKDKP
jgi:hypothetical protein